MPTALTLDNPSVGNAAPTPMMRLMAALTPDVDRRRKPRVAIPYLLRLTPLVGQGREYLSEQAGEASTVVGKDISESGMGFYHDASLPYRFVRLTLDDARIGSFEIVLQLVRCRFTKIGWYETAGRIVEVNAG